MSDKRNKILCGPRIPHMQISPDMSVVELIETMSRSGAYQGGRLAEACKIYQRMLEREAVVALTLSGAMTPVGMGGAIATMIQNGMIDWIVSTGANVFHDLHFALDLDLHQGHHEVDDALLRKHKIDRIYDIFLPDEIITETDKWLVPALAKLNGQEPMSTAKLHNLLGHRLLEDGVNPEKSFLATAAKYDVPIYTSSPGDSEIGMDLAIIHLFNGKVMLDPVLDVIETTAIINAVERSGVIIIGGGSPKNFFLQTQPMLDAGLGIKTKGHDYDIQIGTDPPHWGGLSGATPTEAVSWGKVNPEKMQNSVVVYSDATIAAPILFSYALSTSEAKPHKRLYTKLDEFDKKLKREIKKPLFNFS